MQGGKSSLMLQVMTQDRACSDERVALEVGGSDSKLSSCCLLLALVLVARRDLVVLELVRVLRARDDPQVIPQLLLLQVPLGQVLELALGQPELRGGGHRELRPVPGDGNAARREVSRLALDLDPLREVLLEGRDVKDLVVHRGLAVDHELDRGLLRGLAFRLEGWERG